MSPRDPAVCTPFAQAIKPLLAEQLRPSVRLDALNFEDTRSLPDLDIAIGQERAIEAIQFGIAIKQPGFNIFSFGLPGVGKEHAIRRALELQAKAEPTPDDWCYVYNFLEPHKPSTMRLPPGRGLSFQRDMASLVKELKAAIPASFESEDYRSRHQAIEQEFKQRQADAFNALGKKGVEKQIGLIHGPFGFALVPLRDGEPLKPDDFEKLPDNVRKSITAEMEALQKELEALLEKVPVWAREQRDKMRKLNRERVHLAVSHLLDEQKQHYKDIPVVTAYLAKVQSDVLENADVFLARPESSENIIAARPRIQEAEDEGAVLRRYKVNTIVAHEREQGAPVIFEDHPSLENLIGRIEHISHLGTLVTDFGLIKAGALHRANGGYLVLDARRVLSQPFAWEELKRALRSRTLRIQSLGQLLSLVSTISLEPEPIPLDIKVVLLGDQWLYYALNHYDPDFAELFKVSADFESEIPLSDENKALLARLIATIGRKEQLRPFKRSAVERMIEHAARLAEDSERSTAKIEQMADVMREANVLASRSQSERVDGFHIDSAIAAQVRRSSRVHDRHLDQIVRGTILIETDGMVVGQVNGLSVVQLDDHAFGQPAKITARARFGRGQLVDIEREVKLGGPIHSKGVMILSSFLTGRYVRQKPLSLSASLVFEQSYGHIEGDSASLAELCALLSVLADAPIYQGVAVTGSINQLGVVQPVGAINEKIEGFFDVCRALGPNPRQGVIIPASNVKNLVLRRDVVEAVNNDQFKIYAAATVDQAMELLTGVLAGVPDAAGTFPENSINGRIERQLVSYAEIAQKFAAPSAEIPQK